MLAALLRLIVTSSDIEVLEIVCLIYLTSALAAQRHPSSFPHTYTSSPLSTPQQPSVSQVKNFHAVERNVT